MYSKIILVKTLGLGFLSIPLLSSYVQGQTQTQGHKTITIFTGPIHLGNGQTYWKQFHIPQNITSSYLKGYVRASGSIVNTVTVKLYDLNKCAPLIQQVILILINALLHCYPATTCKQKKF